jgi:hypothetical protein
MAERACCRDDGGSGAGDGLMTQANGALAAETFKRRTLRRRRSRGGRALAADTLAPGHTANAKGPSAGSTAGQRSRRFRAFRCSLHAFFVVSRLNAWAFFSGGVSVGCLLLDVERTAFGRGSYCASALPLTVLPPYPLFLCCLRTPRCP